jgi:peroxiredoxin
MERLDPGGGGAMPNPNKGLRVGSQAPDFALSDTAGQTVRLADYRGQWVIVLFFRGTF